MIAGSFGLAAIVKARAPQLPFWALLLASQLLDGIFIVLTFFGVESYSAASGTNGGYGNMVVTADYTHSLAGALAISLVVAVVTMILWGRNNGLIIGAMVFSNWLLGLLAYRGDFAVLPWNMGGLPRFGLNVDWLIWLSAAVSLVLVLVGAYLYYHAAMRTAAKAERQETKSASGAPTTGYRQRARIASITLFVLLVATLIGNVLGY